MKVKSIEIPIYGGSIIVVNTQGNMQAAIDKYNLTNNAKECNALVFKKDTEKYLKIYAVFNKWNGSIIAHECVHITNHIFESRYMQLDFINDEPYAYLLAWVFEKVEKILNK